MLAKIDVPRTAKSYLNFARIDKLESFGDAEGLLFYATPDMLSGLVTGLRLTYEEMPSCLFSVPDVQCYNLRDTGK